MPASASVKFSRYTPKEGSHLWGSRGNTVYLSLKDEWLTFDAWRVSVIGVFDRVDGHLAFDDSGVGSVGAGGEQFVEDLVGDALAGVGESVRGKNPGGWRWFAERPGGSG